MKKIYYYLHSFRFQTTTVTVCLTPNEVRFSDGKIIKLEQKVNIHQFQKWCDYQNSKYNGAFPKVFIYECFDIQTGKYSLAS